MLVCNSITRQLVIVAFLLSFSSCSWIGSSADPNEGQDVSELSTSLHPVNDTSSPTKKLQYEQVELLWEVPENPVDAYIIFYGFEKSALDFRVKLQSSEIEKHTNQGNEVYRFRLNGIPKDQDVYVSIASVKNDVISPASEPMLVGNSNSI